VTAPSKSSDAEVIAWAMTASASPRNYAWTFQDHPQHGPGYLRTSSSDVADPFYEPNAALERMRKEYDEAHPAEITAEGVRSRLVKAQRLDPTAQTDKHFTSGLSAIEARVILRFACHEIARHRNAESATGDAACECCRGTGTITGCRGAPPCPACGGGKRAGDVYLRAHGYAKLLDDAWIGEVAKDLNNESTRAWLSAKATAKLIRAARDEAAK